MTGPMHTRWDDRQLWWKENKKTVIGWVIIAVIIIGAIIMGMILVPTRKPAVTKKPTPVSTAQTTQRRVINEYTYVFDVGSKPSNVWVFPTNTKGWILTWNADDLTVPYLIITDHGTFACWPGGGEMKIGPTRSIAFQSLSNTTTKIRAMLSKP